MKRRALIAGAVIVLGIAAALAPWSRTADGPAGFLGYVEGESLLIGPKDAGRLAEVRTRQGEVVSPGALLFRLDAETQKGQVAEASARLARAKAQLADLRAAQQRPEQIDILRAARRRAEAALALSRSEYERQKKLFERRIAAQARLERAETAYERDRAALREITQQIEAARLAAREGQIEAAKAEVAAAAAALRQACAALDERTVAAPQAGRVLDVFFRAGEVVGAGQPVVDVLPPENVLVRFYVPEPRLAGIALGDRVAVSCDGCPAGIEAEVTFIASEAEFTPPVIFTREERAKLVFLVEARPLAAENVLKPGLPVEVLPESGEGDAHAGS